MEILFSGNIFVISYNAEPVVVTHTEELAAVAHDAEPVVVTHTEELAASSGAEPAVFSSAVELAVGHYVSVGYFNKWYLGIVEEVKDDEVLVKFMQVKGDNKFVWPRRDDKLAVPMTDILCVIKVDLFSTILLV